jgi:hypothetical protein
LEVIFSGWVVVFVHIAREEMNNLAFQLKGQVMNDGGFSKYIFVPSYRFLLKVDKKFSLPIHELAADYCRCRCNIQLNSIPKSY